MNVISTVIVGVVALVELGMWLAVKTGWWYTDVIDIEEEFRDGKKTGRADSGTH